MGRKAFSRKLAEQNGLPGDRYPVTDEEARKAAEALEFDFQKLSFVDREKLVFDIHGLPVADPENPSKLLQQKLAALEKELQAVPAAKKSAYEHALYLNSDYVQGNLRTMFLQSHDWDPQLAADQMVQHFENKRALFGAGNILGREVLLSDLSSEDLECLETSRVQVLPSRDAAGRLVLFCAPGCGKPDFSESVFRAYWYFQQSLLREEGVAEHGYVFVNYNLGKYGTVVEFDALEEISNKLFDGACLKMVVEHFCLNDPTMNNWVDGAALFSDDSSRHRLRCHFGNKSEVLFKLQTYGIPTHEFPINEEQTLEFGWHRQWIDVQRNREAAVTPDVVTIPRRFDVLFGRGCDTRVHSGNLRAQHLVEMRFEEYERASKKEKTAIAEQIVAEIKESHGRFLKSQDDGSGWVEVDSDTARYKIAHFFRRMRNSKRESGAGRKAS